MNEPLLTVKHLTQYFPIRKGFPKRTVGHVRALDGVSFHVMSGETLGVVGESGCGKSTTGRSILRLHEPTSGEVWFENEDLLSLDEKRMRAKRRDIQMIFQDPYASLNPRLSIYELLDEALMVHGLGDRAQRQAKIHTMIEAVGLRVQHLQRYPHDFSGGQRQRIGIARALILQPKLIIADEPVSALDVSIQSQVLNLLKELKRSLNLTVIFISHDLSVVKHICQRVMVMYLGKVVEMTDTQTLFRDPQHPYTQALLSAIPIANPMERKTRILLTGDLPSPANPPPGCAFHTRCPKAIAVCQQKAPALQGEHHQVACHLVHPEAAV